MCWCGSCNEFFPPHHQHEMNCGNMVVWRPISLNRRLIALHYTYGMCIIVSFIMLITQLGFLIRRLFQPWRWKFIHLLQSKKKLSNPVNAAHPYKHICSGLLFFCKLLNWIHIQCYLKSTKRKSHLNSRGTLHKGYISFITLFSELGRRHLILTKIASFPAKWTIKDLRQPFLFGIWGRFLLQIVTMPANCISCNYTRKLHTWIVSHSWLVRM